eukprot:TRINITY_DN5747_c0_g1_i1.p1 TRINITY_DN5747_c0_g1~~TRINITY_DN5747_c0_g1_i1.p1  ORF type:complete len:246 (+),score=22.81 TRINITY_DN5747_c0_g1_i1:196-933(+)
MVGQSTRFFLPFMKQRAEFENGHLGVLELVEAHYMHRMDWFYEKSDWSKGENFDWIFGGLSHPVDLVCWYLGKIKAVSALGSKSELARKYNVQSNDVYVAHMISFEGKIGRVMGNYGLRELPTARNAIECMLFGSKSTSMAQYHDMRYLYNRQDGTEVKEDFLYENRSYYFNNEVHGMHYGEFANYLDTFCRCVRNGQKCSPDLNDGIELFCVLEAIHVSAVHGGVQVEVSQIRGQLNSPLRAKL